MAPQRYTKRPVTIDAIHWDGTVGGATEVINWVLAEGGTARYHQHEEPHLHSGWCRCDGRGIVPGSGSAVACPETEPTGPGTPARIAIDTLEGTVTASAGDWVIRGVQGEFYPCKPDIFAATYDVPEQVG